MAKTIFKWIPHPLPAEYRAQLQFLGRNCLSHYGAGEHRPIINDAAYKSAARELNNYLNHIRTQLGIPGVDPGLSLEVLE